MIEYIAKRLIWTPILLLIASFFVFFMGNIAPGDPAELILKNRATPEKINALREEMGLNKPLVIRYFFTAKARFAARVFCSSFIKPTSEKPLISNSRV